MNFTQGSVRRVRPIGGGVYAYRCRKPGARCRIPLVSFHWGYVGQTRAFYLRDQQHMYGLSNHGPAVAKDWSDLVVRCYRLSLPDWRWLRLLVERVAIQVLAPVYNVQGNGWNPRRIPPAIARWQRRQRDAGRAVLNLRPVHAVLLFVVLLVVLAGIGWWLQ